MAKLELDYMEYANDAAAQAAYVSSDLQSAIIKQLAQTTNRVLGDYNNVETRLAQSFTLTEGNTIIKGISAFFVTRTGSPSGNITFKIETDDDDKPSGILAHANASKTLASVTDEAWNDFIFDSDFGLPAGYYWIKFDCVNQSTNDRWRIGENAAGGYADGHGDFSDDGVWQGIMDERDFQFKLYSVSPQCYSEDAIVQQGSYSLKVVAAQTESLNDTLTKSGLSIDLSDRTTLKLYVRADRTGTNIQARLYDSVGGWITKDVNVTSTGAFVEIDVDVSGVPNANKSDITKIEFKILNADSDTTYYIDNFYSPEVIVGNAIFFGTNF